MQFPTITRAQFHDAIEAGIADASDFGIPVEADSRLRRVGQTATWIGVGSFGLFGCGCPLTRAGLANRQTGGLTPLARRLGLTLGAAGAFATAFDEAVMAAIRDNDQRPSGHKVRVRSC